jgi:hypothetical protein
MQAGAQNKREAGNGQQDNDRELEEGTEGQRDGVKPTIVQ